MNRDRENRQILEELGWAFKRTGPDVTMTRPSDGARYTGFGPSPDVELRLVRDHGPDFYASEEASAMLLEAMPRPRLYRTDYGSWACWPDGNKRREVSRADSDRKTVIAESFRAWKGLS